MPRRPIGDVAMSDAERSRRRRAKAKALGDAASKAANPMTQSAPVPSACAPSFPVLDFLAGGPEAIAARIFEAVPVDTARGIAMALQQRLWHGGSWPSWAPPIL